MTASAYPIKDLEFLEEINESNLVSKFGGFPRISMAAMEDLKYTSLFLSTAGLPPPLPLRASPFPAGLDVGTSPLGPPDK